MKQVVIENPVINSPFEEPKRHFRFSAEGITNDIVESRRISAYFIPIAAPKKKSKQAQLSFETEWTQDRVNENKFINRVSERNYSPDFLVRIKFPSPPARLAGDNTPFPFLHWFRKDEMAEGGKKRE